VLSADLVLVVLAGTLLILAMTSRLTEQLSLSPVLLALVTDAVMGPEVLGILDLTEQVPRHVVLEQVSRVALALLAVDIGLRVRAADLRDNARRLAVLLGLVMPATWLLSALGGLVTLRGPIADLQRFRTDA